MHKLILASSSPRRAMLLREAGYKFEVISMKVSEILDKNLNLDAAIMAIARDKAVCVMHSGKLSKNIKNLILSGDTVVCIDGEVLGKPINQDQAHEFLSKLSEKTHLVKTAICLIDTSTGKEVSHCETSKVTFRQLLDQEICDYIATGEPMDKAGAYGIQGMGSTFIKSVDGSLKNVIGLPVEVFERLLTENGWIVDRSTL